MADEGVEGVWGNGRFLHWDKEGGTWGKHCFPHGSEQKASDLIAG
jgi:hypothetical protein